MSDSTKPMSTFASIARIYPYAKPAMPRIILGMVAALIAGVVALITVLVGFLAGLTGGLATQNVSAVLNLDASRIVTSAGAQSFADSALTADQVARWQAAGASAGL